MAGGADWTGHVSDAFHHMGTTRMGTIRARAPPTPTGSCRRAGLYAAGASLFPAAGYVNPTLRLAALAIRLGDHLKSRLA